MTRLSQGCRQARPLNGRDRTLYLLAFFGKSSAWYMPYMLRPVATQSALQHCHNIPSFMHTFTHRRRCQPCKAAAGSSGAVRVRCFAQGHLDKHRRLDTPRHSPCSTAFIHSFPFDRFVLRKTVFAPPGSAADMRGSNPQPFSYTSLLPLPRLPQGYLSIFQY